VQRGVEVGVVRVFVGDDLAVEKPVFTAADVGTGSMTRRAFDAATQLLIGWL
jgi:D-alanyl-D-alanine carboxypeptidase (penicillin-binding protein 5/6)